MRKLERNSVRGKSKTTAPKRAQKQSGPIRRKAPAADRLAESATGVESTTDVRSIIAHAFMRRLRN